MVTNITDKSIEYLIGLKNLKKVFLNGTKITPEGVKKLKEVLLNCKVYY